MKIKQIAKIRETAEAERALGGRVRYSDEIKKSAVKLLSAGDISSADLAKATGIGEGTLISWAEGNSFKKLKLLSTGAVNSNSGLSVILPNGVRIEGFSLSEVRGLLEALAS